MAAPVGASWFSPDLFPTRWSIVVFVSYMVLFINQGLLITASKNKENAYNYNTITVVLLTECLKLVIATGVLLKDYSIKKMLEEIVRYSKVLLLYFVPALLYCLYNNLAFVNLAAFDPTTYYLLLQFRVVVTGIIFQVLFKKHLSRKQWLSLLLLTVGCIVKQLHMNPSSSHSDAISFFNFNLFLILLQVFCSCFAGVYNEYLLKDTGAEVHIMLQNVFMYLDSIVCNLGLLAFNGDLLSAVTPEAIKAVLQVKVVCIMFNNAGIGIVTSLFLKSLNSILKTFASALELMFTAVLSWMIFGIPIDYFTVAAITIVSYATLLYSQNPVVNKPKYERSDSVTEILLEKNGRNAESV